MEKQLLSLLQMPLLSLMRR
ncbi:hypothetical protein LINGRAPRIM_LOCUS734 [Linum grandiflorum]